MLTHKVNLPVPLCFVVCLFYGLCVYLGGYACTAGLQAYPVETVGGILLGSFKLINMTNQHHSYRTPGQAIYTWAKRLDYISLTVFNRKRVYL